MKTFPKPLSAGEERACLERLEAGEPEARTLLIERNMRLVAHVAKKYQNSDYDMEEFISVGSIGLIKAVNTYHRDRGSRFATYAAKCIENEILMLLRSNKKYSREVSLYEPVGVDKDGEAVSLVDLMEAENREMLDDIIRDQDIRELYEAYEIGLKNQEKAVIRMRYGLFGEKARTQREIAAALGISRSYVSRIEKRALKKLREQFGEKESPPYQQKEREVRKT
ncbi:MAG: RNA polymerase sporulation sigma factor SigK [Clostridiales bacterium]|nr:RNA polymerase sporulation sigma factor SigK [Clostridiales bacterium]